MKILFIADYFYPHEVSGAEVSLRLLIDGLSKKDQSVIFVLTPGFDGDPKEDLVGKVKIFRYPFGGKFTGKSLPPGKVTNPIYWLYSAWQIYSLTKEINPDIVHVQGKNHLIGAFISNIFANKKLIYTARDYRPLCDLGMCLSRGNKICSISEYLIKDLPIYVINFTNGGPFAYFRAYLTALLNIPVRLIYKSVLKTLPTVVCISLAEEKIYRSSGISNTVVIYNTAKINIINHQREKEIFYGGRYSLGKGAAILDKIIPEFLDKHSDWKATFIGIDKPEWNHPQLKILGKIPYDQVVEHLSRSAFAVVPSVWPEPFGRAALDPLAVGTPVVSSNRGGLPEIIINNRYGLVLEPTREHFRKGLEQAIKKHPQWQKHINADKSELINKFTINPVNQHLDLYQSLLQ